MSGQSQRLGMTGTELLFVDGFAGPGRYTGGQDGSPILAIESVLSHSHPLYVPISFLFVEEDRNRYIILQDAIKPYEEKYKKSPRIKYVEVIQGDCETELNRIIDGFERDNRKVGPAFFFLTNPDFLMFLCD